MKGELFMASRKQQIRKQLKKKEAKENSTKQMHTTTINSHTNQCHILHLVTQYACLLKHTNLVGSLVLRSSML